MSILETNNLTRSFGSFTAVDRVTMKVEKGEAFALLGPNGAGKSVTLKMLTTLLPPSSGDAVINGFSIKSQPQKIRPIIGYVPQMLSADGSLTGYENLLLFAKLYDIPYKERKTRVYEMLEFMGFSEHADKLVREYSGGMIRRLEIAQAILHNPPLLFLDEPTTGLDPLGRNMVWEHIKALQKKYDTTIIMTTHMMEEAEHLCSHAGLMSRGKLAASGSVRELKSSIGKNEATLEEVFIHYTADNLEPGDNYRQVQRERRTAKRLG
ncbi:MAG TPA: ATP-binding cassette domain-containing protein [Bacteroidia bacterium]|nr:ATP-binding cassette domain-containing protein [Bacteroidia bacterium]